MLFTKYKIIIILFLTGASMLGQTSHEKIVQDSTKVEIIGDKIYRIHQDLFVKKDSGWASSDSTRVRYSKIALPNILFKQSKTEIVSGSIKDLDDVYILLENNPKILMQINGYSDKVGDKNSNLELSKIRAKIIKINLMERGIKANRLITNGYGDSFLICPSPSEKNQRVEFVLSKIKINN